MCPVLFIFRLYTLDDIFCLIAFVYSVYGTKIDSDLEEQVKVKYCLIEHLCI